MGCQDDISSRTQPILASNGQSNAAPSEAERDPLVVLAYQLRDCVTASGGIDLRNPELLHEAADALCDAAGLIFHLQHIEPSLAEVRLKELAGFDTDNFGAALYAKFWQRNNARDVEPWATQAEAIRTMWRCIALDAARYLLGAEGAASHVREGEAERVAGSDSPGTSSNPLPVPLERKT